MCQLLTVRGANGCDLQQRLSFISEIPSTTRITFPTKIVEQRFFVYSRIGPASSRPPRRLLRGSVEGRCTAFSIPTFRGRTSMTCFSHLCQSDAAVIPTVESIVNTGRSLSRTPLVTRANRLLAVEHSVMHRPSRCHFTIKPLKRPGCSYGQRSADAEIAVFC
jgi:hypothetical protein